VQHSPAQFFRSLLAVREEGAAEHLLARVDDRKVVPVALHLSSQELGPLGQVLIVGPGVIHFLHHLVEHVGGVGARPLVLLLPQAVEVGIALGRDFALRLVDSPGGQQSFQVGHLVQRLLAAPYLRDEGPREDGSVGWHYVD
jgi:hypothetical protein